MPVAAFTALCNSWPNDNSQLDIKRLRLKCLTLLALTLMLRPSDIVPHSQTFEGSSCTTKRRTFSTDMVEFHINGGCTVTLHGTKNDTARNGFVVNLPSGTDKGRILSLHCRITSLGLMYIELMVREQCSSRCPLRSNRCLLTPSVVFSVKPFSSLGCRGWGTQQKTSDLLEPPRLWINT